MASDAPNGTPVPRAVLRMKADTDRRVAEFNAQRTPTEPPPPASETVPPATPPVEAPAPAAATPAAPPEDPRHSDPQYWKGRYLAADGLMRKRGQELVDAREQLRTREAELQAQIVELNARIPAAQTELSRYFTPEQIAQYGEDQCRIMVTAAERAAGDTVARELGKQAKPPAPAPRNDGHAAVAAAAQAAEDANAQFQAELDQLLPPNWRDIDTQQPWLDWLGQVGESGVPRGDLLRAYAGRYDAQRSAQMMLAWLETQKPAPRPAPPVTPNGTGAGGVGNAPTPPAAATKGLPTKAEIQDFYKRAGLGKVSDAERTEFEARLRLLRAA